MGGIQESGYLVIWLFGYLVILLFGYWTSVAGYWLLARLRVSRFGSSAVARHVG
jgi:hypothetical protein